jgi:hypothetical protein
MNLTTAAALSLAASLLLASAPAAGETPSAAFVREQPRSISRCLRGLRARSARARRSSSCSPSGFKVSFQKLPGGKRVIEIRLLAERESLDVAA